MKHWLLSLSILIGCSFAQAQDIDSVTLGMMKLNFVVPDMPAFKSLGTEPSNLLRPSSPQAIALGFSEFYQDRKFLLPEAFAMEISPSLLLNAKKRPAELGQYVKRAVWNSFRISLGTAADSANPFARNAALGLRMSLINKGDAATDITFHQQVAAILRTVRQNFVEDAKKAFAAQKGYTGNDLDLFISENLREFQGAVDTTQSIQEPFDRLLKKVKDQYKKDHWNDTKLDVAVAIMSSSSDSLIKNIQFNKASFWLTYAAKIGTTGQLLIGVNSNIAKPLLDTALHSTDKSYFSVYVPVRYLAGTNRIKGFAEAQYAYQQYLKESKFLFNLGAEVNIVDGLWVNLYGGLDFSSVTKSSFRSNLNVKLTIPEKFKFF